MVNLGELSPPPARMSPKDVLEIRTIAIDIAARSVTAGQRGIWDTATRLADDASTLLRFASLSAGLNISGIVHRSDVLGATLVVPGMRELIVSSRKRDDSLTGTEKEAKLLVRRAVEIVESYLDAEPLCCATTSGA